MSILVVGSVAFDSVKTPFGERERILGGSATYFSVAASFFTDVRVVAVVGEDFGPEEDAVFLDRKVDISDLERVPGRSFYWSGEYGFDLNVAKTRDTQLNVFADFKPSFRTERERRLICFSATFSLSFKWKCANRSARNWSPRTR